MLSGGVSGGRPFLCELQIQHRDIFEAEQGRIVELDGRETTPHDRYIQYRNYRAE